MLSAHVACAPRAWRHQSFSRTLRPQKHNIVFNGPKLRHPRYCFGCCDCTVQWTGVVLRPAAAPCRSDFNPETRAVLMLADVCLIVNRGWWTYEWCHLRHVRQFHVEPDGQQTSIWSMGTFQGNAARHGITPPADISRYCVMFVCLLSWRCCASLAPARLADRFLSLA